MLTPTYAHSHQTQLIFTIPQAVVTDRICMFGFLEVIYQRLDADHVKSTSGAVLKAYLGGKESPEGKELTTKLVQGVYGCFLLCTKLKRLTYTRIHLRTRTRTPPHMNIYMDIPTHTSTHTTAFEYTCRASCAFDRMSVFVVCLKLSFEFDISFHMSVRVLRSPPSLLPPFPRFLFFESITHMPKKMMQIILKTTTNTHMHTQRAGRSSVRILRSMGRPSCGGCAHVPPTTCSPLSSPAPSLPPTCGLSCCLRTLGKVPCECLLEYISAQKSLKLAIV